MSGAIAGACFDGVVIEVDAKEVVVKQLPLLLFCVDSESIRAAPMKQKITAT